MDSFDNLATTILQDINFRLSTVGVVRCLLFLVIDLLYREMVLRSLLLSEIESGSTVSANQ